MRKDIKVETILLSPVSRVILSGLSFKKQSTIKLDFIYRETITGNVRESCCTFCEMQSVVFVSFVVAIFKITLSLCVYYKLFSNCKLNFDYPFYSRHYDNFYYYFIFYYIVFRFLFCVRICI